MQLQATETRCTGGKTLRRRYWRNIQTPIASNTGTLLLSPRLPLTTLSHAKQSQTKHRQRHNRNQQCINDNVGTVEAFMSRTCHDAAALTTPWSRSSLLDLSCLQHGVRARIKTDIEPRLVSVSLRAMHATLDLHRATAVLTVRAPHTFSHSRSMLQISAVKTAVARWAAGASFYSTVYTRQRHRGAHVWSPA